MTKTATSQSKKSKVNGGKNNGKAHKTLKLKWQKTFIKELRKSGNVAKSCRKANVSRKWAYEKRQEDELFAEQWQDALEGAIDDLEEEAHSRAMDGNHQGDGMIRFLLQAHRPEKYGKQHIEHTGAGGAPLFDMKSVVGLLQKAEKEMKK